MQLDYSGGAPGAKTGINRYMPKKRIYSDFDFGFEVHPVSKQLLKKYDDRAINQSLINLILTNPKERPFQPWIGSRVNSALFEPLSPIVEDMLEREIKTVIEEFEPRVLLTNVKVIADYEWNSYNVTIEYRIINRPEPLVFEFVLKRNR